LNVNDDLGLAQFFAQAQVFAAQFLVFLGQRVALGLGATPPFFLEVGEFKL
jgi:hypothetical protein